MAGIRLNQAPISRFDTPAIAPSNPTMQFGNPNTFTTAATQQAKDYDKIMGQYGDIYNRGLTNPLSYSNITPQTTDYTKSADVTKSLSDLSGLSDTGGYTDQGIADLRSRGIAPVRAVYANAQRGLDRSKALAGGYSPNYAAATAKMAREMSDQVSQAEQNVNAGIAQNVASNKLAAAPAYASAASRENEDRMSTNTHNSDIINQINQFNASNALDAQKYNRNTGLEATQGMASLYGTTPALTNTFGNQVVAAAQLGQGQQQINNQRQDSVNRSILQPRFRNG